LKSSSYLISFLGDGLAEIKLAWHEKSSNQNTELLKWLCNGIMLEDELYVLYNNNL
jgi:hypothetical protein